MVAAKTLKRVTAALGLSIAGWVGVGMIGQFQEKNKNAEIGLKAQGIVNAAHKNFYDSLARVRDDAVAVCGQDRAGLRAVAAAKFVFDDNADDAYRAALKGVGLQPGHHAPYEIPVTGDGFFGPEFASRFIAWVKENKVVLQVVQDQSGAKAAEFYNGHAGRMMIFYYPDPSKTLDTVSVDNARPVPAGFIRPYMIDEMGDFMIAAMAGKMAEGGTYTLTRSHPTSSVWAVTRAPAAPTSALSALCPA